MKLCACRTRMTFGARARHISVREKKSSAGRAMWPAPTPTVDPGPTVCYRWWQPGVPRRPLRPPNIPTMPAQAGAFSNPCSYALVCGACAAGDFHGVSATVLHLTTAKIPAKADMQRGHAPSRADYWTLVIPTSGSFTARNDSFTRASSRLYTPASAASARSTSPASSPKTFACAAVGRA